MTDRIAIEISAGLLDANEPVRLTTHFGLGPIRAFPRLREDVQGWFAEQHQDALVDAYCVFDELGHFVRAVIVFSTEADAIMFKLRWM